MEGEGERLRGFFVRLFLAGRFLALQGDDEDGALVVSKVNLCGMVRGFLR